MEFSKILNFFTVSAIVILLLTTFVATGITIVSRAEGNLGVSSMTQSLKSCTQNQCCNC